MYDIIDDIMLVPDRSYLNRGLSMGLRKIFLRQKIHETQRLLKLQWISPYPQKPEDSYFLFIQNGLKFFGDIGKVYYNPRYSTERLSLVDYLNSRYTFRQMGIIGSGISPYTIYFLRAKPNLEIAEYEINPDCIRFGNINKSLNLPEDIHGKIKTELGEYKNIEHQVLLVIMPSKELSFYKNLRFSKVLVLYLLCQVNSIDSSLKSLGEFYDLDREKFTYKLVREYSKLKKIYRIVIEK